MAKNPNAFRVPFLGYLMEELAEIDTPERNLMAAVVSRSIIDSYQYFRPPAERLGINPKWRAHYGRRHEENAAILFDWAFNDDAVPINLVWIAQHLFGERWEFFVESTRNAMSDVHYKPDSRLFSFRRTYGQERGWKRKRKQ